MVVPSTADGFRATICALRSLDGGKGVNFHTSLPEDRCVRLLVKNLGKGMPKSAVREELESLNIRVQGVMQLQSGRRDQDPAKDRPPTPHFIVSGTGSGGVQSALSRQALRFAGYGGDVRGAKGPTAMQALPILRPHAAELRVRSSVRRMWGLSPLW